MLNWWTSLPLASSRSRSFGTGGPTFELTGQTAGVRRLPIGTDMQSNPYESPRCAVPQPLTRSQLLPAFPELVFLAILAAASILIHWTHRDIFNLIGGGTVFVLVGCSTILSLGGCGTTSLCKRSNHLMSSAAFFLGMVSTAATAVLACWLLISTGQPPSGLVVFVSVVAGMVATNLILILRTDSRRKLVEQSPRFRG